jgi:RNA polymerase sigma factor (sigma-70 family)
MPTDWPTAEVVRLQKALAKVARDRIPGDLRAEEQDLAQEALLATIERPFSEFQHEGAPLAYAVGVLQNKIKDAFGRRRRQAIGADLDNVEREAVPNAREVVEAFDASLDEQIATEKEIVAALTARLKEVDRACDKESSEERRKWTAELARASTASAHEMLRKAHEQVRAEDTHQHRASGASAARDRREKVVAARDVNIRERAEAMEREGMSRRDIAEALGIGRNRLKRILGPIKVDPV